MIKIKNGEFKANGNVVTVVSDMACIVYGVFSILAERGESKEAIEKSRELVNDAIALALGEKTDEEVFGTDDDDIESMIDNIIKALTKARK